MYLQYTRNMHGMDTVDQICSMSSCMTRFHKWWHHIFFYMLDTIVSNMWIIHSDLNFMVLQELLTHMAFQLQFAKDLESKWGGKKHGYSTFALYRPTAHGPKSMGKKQGLCKVCGEWTNQACPRFQVHICKGSCYWDNY